MYCGQEKLLHNTQTLRYILGEKQNILRWNVPEFESITHDKINAILLFNRDVEISSYDDKTPRSQNHISEVRKRTEIKSYVFWNVNHYDS